MFFGWYIVAACALISMYLSGTITIGFTTIFDPIAHETGWSYTQISFAASLRGFGVGLLVPISGMIMDRWGARRLVFAGSILTGAGMLMLSRVHSLLMFYFAFGLVCVGVSSAPAVLLMSAVANWFRKHEGLAMGIAASGVSLGGLLIPVMTHCVDSYGWRQTMALAGLGVWAIVLPLTLLLRHKPEMYGVLPDGEAAGDLELKNPSIHGNRQIFNVGAKEALAQPVFWIIALAFVFHVMAVSAITTHIMPFFRTVGFARTQSGLIISAVPLMGIFGRVGFGWLGDRIDRIKVATLALALSGLGVFIFMYVTADRPWVIILFILVFGVGWGGTVPMLSGLVIKFFGRLRMGTIIGCISCVMMAGILAGAPLAGWTFDLEGSYRMAWFIMGSMLSAVTVVFYFFLRYFGRQNETFKHCQKSLQIPHYVDRYQL
ncbi:MAG: MFS transporter [Deltaproteobacteria bacterium]